MQGREQRRNNMATYEIDYWVRFYNGTITIEAENERKALEEIDLKVLRCDEKLLQGLDVEWDLDGIKEI